MKSVIFNIFKTIYISLILSLLIIESYIGFDGFKHDASLITFESPETTNIVDPSTNMYSREEEVKLRVDQVQSVSNNSFVYFVMDRQNIQGIRFFINNILVAEGDINTNYNIVFSQNKIIIPLDTTKFTEQTSLHASILSRNSYRHKDDVYLVSQNRIKQLMLIDQISMLIKGFIIFSSSMIGIGFIGFNKIVIEPINRKRAQSFYFASGALIIFCAHSYSNQFNSKILYNLLLAQRVEDLFYLGSISMITYALYIRIKDSLTLKLCYLQSLITIGSIILGFWFVDTNGLFSIVKMSVLLIAIIIAFIYVNYPQSEKNYKNRLALFMIIAFLVFGQLIMNINLFNNYIPNSITDISLKMIPIAISTYLLIRTVFVQFFAIQKASEQEHEKLVSLNTNIYEYVSEGVFSITENLLVSELYTKVCLKIFGRDLSGTSVSELLCDQDTPPELINRLLNDFFENKISWIACKELMPQELIQNNHFYELNYQLIRGFNNQREIVVRLKEISEQKELEDSVAFERDKLALSITSLMNREELVPLVNEFIEFMQIERFDNASISDTLNTLHTFKGNFGVFNFIHVLKAIHDLESKIIEDDHVTQENISEVIEELYKDLEIISEITGSSFFEDTLYLKANINNLEGVYSEVKKYFYDTEASLIIYIIKKIFNKSLKDIILFYAREARKKAVEKNKDIKTIEVTGDDVFLDYQYYRHALRSLVHIFNNCIDHGIEDEEERLILGKPRSGEIQCRISDFGNFVEIMIKDDGRGINVERLTKILLKENIISEDELTQLTEEEILDYVFHGEVSTLEETSFTSGRGVGLASVKKEVESVGGEIRISSFVDFGTEVKILIPKENDALISYFSLPLLMDLYVEAFKIFIKSNNIFELPLNVIGSEKIPELYEFNVKIRFEGPESGYFFFSCNYEVLWKFACFLTDDPNLNLELFEDIKNETVKETCNIIAGNSTSVFDLNQKYILIESPELIEKGDVDLFSLVYKWHMRYGDYSTVLGLILD